MTNCAAVFVSHFERARVSVPSRKCLRFVECSRCRVRRGERRLSAVCFWYEILPHCPPCRLSSTPDVFEVSHGTYAHLAHCEEAGRMLTGDTHCVCTLLASVAIFRKQQRKQRRTSSLYHQPPQTVAPTSSFVMSLSQRPCITYPPHFAHHIIHFRAASHRVILDPPHWWLASTPQSRPAPCPP
jgi:hypothetical protein